MTKGHASSMKEGEGEPHRRGEKVKDGKGKGTRKLGVTCTRSLGVLS